MPLLQEVIVSDMGKYEHLVQAQVGKLQENEEEQPKYEGTNKKAHGTSLSEGERHVHPIFIGPWTYE